MTENKTICDICCNDNNAPVLRVNIDNDYYCCVNAPLSSIEGIYRRKNGCNNYLQYMCMYEQFYDIVQKYKKI